MSEPSVKSVLICGAGLVFEMALAALSKTLPSSIEVTALEITGHKNTDGFYGHITPPTAYNFLVSLGLDETELFLRTNTSFTYGTAYENWGGRNWAQCYAQPFPVWDNVLFHQYLTRLGAPLAPFLVGSVAGLNGRFAHPPADPNIPLSRAEYGYQIDPASISAWLKRQSLASNITRLSGEISKIKTKTNVSAIKLEDGRTLSADLFIDCTGSGGIMAELGNSFVTEQTLGVKELHAMTTPDAAQSFTLKHIKTHDKGWGWMTRLQGETIQTMIGHESDMDGADYTMSTGSRPIAWSGNCVAIGHSACITEPLTPAPMILLQRDIERLLSLFPVTRDMDVEAREYNRLFANDRDNCALFTSSLFQVDGLPDGAYWDAAKSRACPDKLTRKITQFESRGYLTQYDLEPFNAEDWIIQHMGLGRTPKRYDVYLDQLSPDDIKNRLMQMKTNIETMVQKMPPGDRYLENFKTYLQKNNGG